MPTILQPLFIPVRGMTPAPAVPTDQKARERMWTWQRFVVQETRAKYDKSHIHGIKQGTRFVVAIVFRLTLANIRRIDLDNLAKPVLDSLFRPNYQISEDRAGALFDIDDVNVFKLTVEKIIVLNSEEEGADITITWE